MGDLPPPYSDVVRTASNPRPVVMRSRSFNRSSSAERPNVIQSNGEGPFSRNSVFTSSGRRYHDLPPGWRPPPMPAVGLYPTAPPSNVQPVTSPGRDHLLKEKLASEIHQLEEGLSGKMPYLTALFQDVKQASELIATKKEVLLWELTSWKEELIEEINQHYETQVAKLEHVHKVESRRVEQNLQLVRKAKEDCERILGVGPSALESGSRAELVAARGRLEVLKSEVRAMERDALTVTSAGEWRYNHPDKHGMNKRVQSLMGFVDAHISEVPVNLSPSSGAGAAAAPDFPTEHRGSAAYITKTYGLISSFPTKTNKDKARCHPLSFVLSEDGSLIVPDRYNHKLKVFTIKGQLLREISHPAMKAPSHVQVNIQGDILVSDSEVGCVHIFNLDGELIGQYLRLVKPAGAIMFSSGYLAVADSELRTVDIFVRPGYSEPATSIRHYTNMVYDQRTRKNVEKTFAHFECPQYLSVNRHDWLAVSDRAANVISIFQDGKRLRSYGSKGGRIGQFSEPYGISFDCDDNLLVADYGNHRVQLIDMKSSQIQPVLFPDLNLKFPTHVEQLSDGRLVVSEYLSGLIKVFGTADHLVEQEQTAPPAYSEMFGVRAASSSRPIHSVPEYPEHAASTMSPGQPAPLGQAVRGAVGESQYSASSEQRAQSEVDQTDGSPIRARDRIRDTNRLLEQYHREMLRQNSLENQAQPYNEWTI